VGVLFVVLPRMIVGVFTSDPAIVPYAVGGLRIVSCGFVFYAFGMVLTQSFNGAGDAWTPTWINIGCFWAFELPLAYLLGRPFGMTGVFISMTLAFSLIAVVSAVLFRRGRWKTRAV
jgi:Na+-driven multidrug efflux pump